ncbi:hypothetical protein GGI04_004841 [Coemansia thaxteri]|uniref:MIR domain-containing protein n=1 Tax=Coemansia thaxteri TaxID=2663907 RepID=A0A9W8EET7_9FUNG|nr:hypothetical protein GGI04_004841 [Coemansia thaxteri]KAJ2002361.1 hypothetical protein H4R26_003648 [Coemansia thaxteri]KAJ2474874.1 hypothetical protein EV174_005477 [Coemansia sp. RSA 2320]
MRRAGFVLWVLTLVALAAGTGEALLFGSKNSDKETAAAAEGGAAGIEEGWEFVTHGSTIKLGHVKSDSRLILPQVSYGTGSQQQAVTAHSDASSTKGFWVVEGGDGDSVERGRPVGCGEQIRLVNSDSNHSLHSHSGHKSPISGAQEVSGFDGRDSGDLWVVECLGKGQQAWARERPVYLKHVETGWYLQSLPSKKYRQPIVGHQEVSAAKRPDSNAQWAALEGYYYR